MRELKENVKMDREKLLKFCLIFTLILSGCFLDSINQITESHIYNNDLFLDQQDMCREFAQLGAYSLAYIFIPFDFIKIKSFTFMFVLWSSVIILYNNYLTHIDNHMTLKYIFYAVYVLWLIRIATMKKETLNVQLNKIKLYESAGVAYNILLPVKTFRGLLQILFVPWRNPLYETRLLVAEHKVYGVLNSKFVKINYNYSWINAMVARGFKIKECKNYKRHAAEYLVGKKMILGLRDCSRLEY